MENVFRIFIFHIVYIKKVLGKASQNGILRKEVKIMLYPKIGDKIYNFGRTEIITDIKVRGPVRYYYTKTKRGSVNFFTDKDFCEQAIKDKRISTKKTTVDLLFG